MEKGRSIEVGFKVPYLIFRLLLRRSSILLIYVQQLYRRGVVKEEKKEIF